MSRIGVGFATIVFATLLVGARGGHASGADVAYTCLPSDSTSETVRLGLIDILTDTSVAQGRVRSALGKSLVVTDSVYLLLPADGRCAMAIGAVDSILGVSLPDMAAYVFRFDDGYAVADSAWSTNGTVQVTVLDGAYAFINSLMLYVAPVDSTG